MIEFINYLERMIEGCESLGGLDREKATYQAVLKEYRKQCDMPIVVGQSELLFAFIKAIKEEFKDENWDYLDFIADRVIGKQ